MVRLGDTKAESTNPLSAPFSPDSRPDFAEVFLGLARAGVAVFIVALAGMHMRGVIT